MNEVIYSDEINISKTLDRNKTEYVIFISMPDASSHKSYWMLTIIFVILSILAGVSYVFFQNSSNSAVNLTGTESQLNGTEPADEIKSCSDTSIYTYETLDETLEKPLEICNLDLSRMSLTEIPQEVYTLKNLETLNLEYNFLESIPDEVAQLSFLKDLNLSNNNLTAFPEIILSLSNLNIIKLNTNEIPLIPVSIVDLSNLKELHLSYNRLTAIPPEIAGLKNLEMLELSNNQLENVPAGIGTLTSLAGLYLGGNGISQLPPDLADLKSLINLYLSNNNFTSVPDLLSTMRQLEILNLDNNNIPEDEIDALRNALPETEISYLTTP